LAYNIFVITSRFYTMWKYTKAVCVFVWAESSVKVRHTLASYRVFLSPPPNITQVQSDS